MTWTWLELELDLGYHLLKVSSFLFGKKWVFHLPYLFIYLFIYCVSSENFQPPSPPWKVTGNLEECRVSQIQTFPKEISWNFLRFFVGCLSRNLPVGYCILLLCFSNFSFPVLSSPFFSHEKNIHFVKR